MSHGNAIAHPPVTIHADNGRAYQFETELELKRLKDALRLKQIEAQCLADLCRKHMQEIRNKNATIALLQKRLHQATIVNKGGV